MALIYLDNGATSFPKPESVYNAHDYALRNYGANPGRGGHSLARECARVIYKTREKIAEFINAKDSSEISFSQNATEAINQGLLGLLKENDHVITSQLEHNSVWRPLNWLKRNRNIQIDLCNHLENGLIDVEHLISLIKPNTKILVINHCSNVFGCMQDIELLGKVTRQNNIVFLVDGAQSLGFEKIDVQRANVDILAFAGHKGLLGPSGTGGLYVNKNIILEPLKTGGTGTKSEELFVSTTGPERYESGTMNTAGIYALGAGLDYIKEIGIDTIKQHKIDLLKRLYNGIGDITCFYGDTSGDIGPVISFNIGELDSTDVAFILDTVYGIAVRAGLHCSPLAHKCFNTLEQGTIRVSPGIFNTNSDIDKLITAVIEIKRG